MREELINSAVTFLQDPSVAASPLEKRIAFLRSKNLTQDEIDAALRRVNESPAAISNALTVTSPYSSPPPPYTSSYYAPQQQQTAPLVPARDWRDYFITATVASAATYTIYTLSKRYILPLISPPTPPQLESDKAAIDAKFNEAFDLLDTLKTDTAALKAAEEERKTRVDAALEEVESVVQSLKDAGKRREDESKRVGDEVRGLRDLIPKALEGQKESQKKALEDLGTELKSLKQLVMNRTAAGRPAVVGPPSYVSGVPSGTPPMDPAASATAGPAGGQAPGAADKRDGQTLGAVSGLRKDGASPLPFGGKPSIPAWQMAARANAPSVVSAPATPGGGAGSAGSVVNGANGGSSASNGDAANSEG